MTEQDIAILEAKLDAIADLALAVTEATQQLTASWAEIRAWAAQRGLVIGELSPKA